MKDCKKLDIRCVAFDVDGVLFSSSKIIADAYAQASLKYSKQISKNLPLHSTETIMREVGKPISEIFRNLFPMLNPLECAALSELSLENLSEMVFKNQGNLLSNVKKIFSYLRSKKIRIVLVSNGRRPYVQAILDAYDLNSFIDILCCVGDSIQNIKFDSKSSLLKYYMRYYLLAPQKILMVGDRYTDYEAALKTYVKFVGVLSGHGTELQSKNISYTIRNLIELKKII